MFLMPHKHTANQKITHWGVLGGCTRKPKKPHLRGVFRSPQHLDEHNELHRCHLHHRQCLITLVCNHAVSPTRSCAHHPRLVDLQGRTAYPLLPPVAIGHVRPMPFRSSAGSRPQLNLLPLVRAPRARESTSTEGSRLVT